jgi:hypothetical protein
LLIFISPYSSWTRLGQSTSAGDLVLQLDRTIRISQVDSLINIPSLTIDVKNAHDLIEGLLGNPIRMDRNYIIHTIAWIGSGNVSQQHWYVYDPIAPTQLQPAFEQPRMNGSRTVTLIALHLNPPTNVRYGVDFQRGDRLNQQVPASARLKSPTTGEPVPSGLTELWYGISNIEVSGFRIGGPPILITVTGSMGANSKTQFAREIFSDEPLLIPRDPVPLDPGK